ncbi:MAG: hypothetical protein NC177_00715 [Ruminococcus flavefaciens]|nr:hypothetical protein [Ruminococcus flavefaciens]
MGDFVIWILMFAIVYMVLNSLKPKEKPSEPEKKPSPPKSDDTEYTRNFKDKIAIEMIKGKSADDIIAEHSSLTADEINKWKNDLLDNISRLSTENADLSMRVGQLYMKVQWLEKTCKTHIGDDWKEKTGYKYL